MRYVTGAVVLFLVTAWAVAVTRERTDHLWHSIGGVACASLAFNLVMDGRAWGIVLVAPALVLGLPVARDAFR